MTMLKIPYHGRTHLPWGSDPIPLSDVPTVWGMLIRDGASSNVSITSGALSATTTLLQHNVVNAEQGVTCDIVSTPSRITIDTDGVYTIISRVVDSDTGVTDYGICIGFGLNTTGAAISPIGADRRILTGGGRPTGIWVQQLAAGDYVTQVVGQNSGITKTDVYLADLTVVRTPG